MTDLRVLVSWSGAGWRVRFEDTRVIAHQQVLEDVVFPLEYQARAYAQALVDLWDIAARAQRARIAEVLRP